MIGFLPHRSGSDAYLLSPTHTPTHTHLLCPGKYDVFLQQVRIVQVFEDDGNARQQLDLMQLHDALKTSQQILLGLLVVVAELKIRIES